MIMKNKQKRALEKITGKRWGTWHPNAIKAYFAFTDRGQSIAVSHEARTDFEKLMFQHHWHSVTVEMWKEDFRVGLLFLDDFLQSPPAYIEHASQIYKSVMGYIPSKYSNIKDLG